MSADAQAGAHVELGPVSLAGFAALEASWDALAAQLKRIADAEEKYQQEGPLFQSIRNAAYATAAGSPPSLYMTLGGPSLGRLWFLRRLITMGSTWGTTALGASNVHVTTTPAPVSGGSDMVDNSLTLPNKAFYSNEQVTLRYPQILVVEFTTPTTSQQYVATGLVMDVPDKARGMHPG